ncbi:MAG TPA: peptidylprolyl isomerase [Myxococcales bacterium]|nr:peptidylprolyl isomerase [Myxococcales bacterium]
MKRVLLACLLCAAAARAELKERVAAIVNGQPILLSDVEERVGPELVRLLTQPAGPQRDNERATLLHRGLNELIDEKLIESEASSLGLTVSEEELQRALDQLARQQNMETADFRQALAQQGISWDTARDTVRRQTLMAEVLRFKVKARKVSDEEVQAAYATEVKNAQYEVRARHIFIATPQNATPAQVAAAQARAEQALRRVKSGETFALVARELSEGPTAKQGGDLGYFRRGLMLPAIEQAAFSLQPGEISPVIKTSSGFHIVMVEDRRPIPPRPLSEVKEEIRNRLANESVFKERENYLATLRKTAQIDEKL